MNHIRRHPILSLAFLLVCLPFCAGVGQVLLPARRSTQHIQTMEEKAIEKCREGVRNHAYGETILGIGEFPRVDRVGPRLWKWREIGVINGVRFGYVCRFNPQVGNMTITKGDVGDEDLGSEGPWFLP